MNLQVVLTIAVGFLVGMIPAMLLVGFFGGRQVEKHRRELKLRYDRQITALRATIRRLMQRIDLLTDERNNLRQSNKGLRDSLRDQNRVADQASSELENNRAELTKLQQQVEMLTAEKLRYEGRLEENRLNQERMEAQFSSTVAQFTEIGRLRSRLLFATDQLQQAHANNEILQAQIAESQMPTQDQDQYTSVSAGSLDLSAIESLEPIYVERLHDSGIHTVADLASQTPARVAHFAGLTSWDESSEWIAEAKALLASSTSGKA